MTEEDAVEAFVTDLGRKVYGGGGITPDVMLEPQGIGLFLQHLLSRNAFFDFSVGYANRHPIDSRDWQPTPAVLESFKHWLIEEKIVEADEWDENVADPEELEAVQRYLHAELFNAEFGIEARYEILANGDTQIRKALSLFDDASDLLARRQALKPEPSDRSEGEPGLLN